MLTYLSYKVISINDTRYTSVKNKQNNLNNFREKNIKLSTNELMYLYSIIKYYCDQLFIPWVYF